LDGGVVAPTVDVGNTTARINRPVAGSQGLVKAGIGTLVLAAANTYTGATNVNDGQLVLAHPSAISGPLNVADAAAGQIAPGLNGAVAVTSLNLAATALLDVNDNDLVIGSATSKTTIESYVRTARNDGAWTGPGLTSSAARENPAGNANLGVLSGAEYSAFGGGTGTFGGKPYTAGDTLVKYTWNGDTNFSGTVNFDDYVRVDVGFNTNLTGWGNGDFNYSGAVDFDDYVLIDVAFNTQNGTLGRAVEYLSGDGRLAAGPDDAGVRMVQEHFGRFGLPYASAFLAAVPEPDWAAVTSVVAVAGTRRRRRRRRRRV
jgi:autotransporter-associated beta strand protein